MKKIQYQLLLNLKNKTRNDLVKRRVKFIANL